MVAPAIMALRWCYWSQSLLTREGGSFTALCISYVIAIVFFFFFFSFVLYLEEIILRTEMVLQKLNLRCKYFEWLDEVESKYEDNDIGNGIVEEESFNESSIGNKRGYQEVGENEAKMKVFVNEANIKVLIRMFSEMKGDIERLEMLLFVVWLGVRVCVFV